MQIQMLTAGIVIAGLAVVGGCASPNNGAAPAPAGPAATAPKTEAPKSEPASARTNDVKYTDLDGKSFTLGELPGQAKVVNYWATWCSPCIKEIPSFNKLHAKYGSQGATFLGVSIDENGAEAVTPFLKTPKGKIDYKVALAKLEDLEPVGVSEAIPVTLVYDASGRLVKRFDGYAEEAELEAAVRAALGLS